MTKFIDLPPIVQGIIGAIVVGQFFYAVMHAAINVKRKNLLNILILVPEIILLYMEFQFIGAIKRNKILVTPLFIKMVEIFSNIPAIFVFLFLIIILFVEAMHSVEYRNWRKNHITDFSVKEAVDNLPEGVCYFEKNGRIILKNKRMENICRSLTQRALLNGLEFQEIVHKNRKYLGNSAILLMPEHTVYSILEEKVQYEDREIYVLVTMDITEQYRKMQSLSEKQKAVQKLNEQLVAYGKEIVSIINAKEILNAKVKLHDEIGLHLLATKKYILRGGTEEELESIKAGLLQNIQYLRHENVENCKDEYRVILDTAQKLNVAICVNGDFPTEEPMKHILVTGIHECLTNTIRHARGNKLMVDIKRTKQQLTATFTNDGNKPSGIIEEKGGLASLRALVEENKGKMKIQTEEQFILIIDFPIS